MSLVPVIAVVPVNMRSKAAGEAFSMDVRITAFLAVAYSPLATLLASFLSKSFGRDSSFLANAPTSRGISAACTAALAKNSPAALAGPDT